MKNTLLTGSPGCGKSTLIGKVLALLGAKATGFFTREIREGGRRKGFALETLDGRRGVLAHVDLESRFRVGKYAVNVGDVEEIAVPSLAPGGPGKVVIVDEIGKMECLSPRFREALLRLLDSESPVIGSVALKGTPFIEEIKRRHDVKLVHVNEKNRDLLAEELVRALSQTKSGGAVD